MEINKGKKMRKQIKREKIIEGAKRLFETYGFERTSMDEIAATLKTSKRTIYSYFPTKDDLILSVVESIISKIHDSMKLIVNSKEGFAEKVKNIFAMIDTIGAKLTPPMIQDLKNMPHIWEKIDARRKEIISRTMERLIEDGQKYGIIKKEIDPEILTQLHISIVGTLVTPTTIIALDIAPNEFIQKLMSIILTGILTEKGRKKFKEVK